MKTTGKLSLAAMGKPRSKPQCLERWTSIADDYVKLSQKFPGQPDSATAEREALSKADEKNKPKRSGPRIVLLVNDLQSAQHRIEGPDLTSL